MTIDKQEIKALAEAATGGEWTCSEKHDGRFWHIRAGNQAIGATHAAGRKSPMAGVFEANAKFIAAASPATVLALLAEIEEDAMHMRAFGEVMRSQTEQVDQLKAENEALRSALGDLLSLYEDDEGCRSLPQYLAGIAVMDKAVSHD
ncbi:ead/Ea22-like family protein [Pseudomonas sp.]|uniref:ead/Ea22-like family protein n=1 Tax=Pseudomonas sp. TaxID=306 RepID=UPI0028AE0350|nr:ead/Ea22-like family protein [Pseudomonas sp.]